MFFYAQRLLNLSKKWYDKKPRWILTQVFIQNELECIFLYDVTTTSVRRVHDIKSNHILNVIKLRVGSWLLHNMRTFAYEFWVGKWLIAS